MAVSCTLLLQLSVFALWLVSQVMLLLHAGLHHGIFSNYPRVLFQSIYPCIMNFWLEFKAVADFKQLHPVHGNDSTRACGFVFLRLFCSHGSACFLSFALGRRGGPVASWMAGGRSLCTT